MPSVLVNNLVKTYGKEDPVLAVNKVSFSVNKSEIFGLVGPDGAGKTSIFRILTTLLLPDSGSAFIEGFNVIKDYKLIRNSVGYMPGKFSLYPDLTVEENLTFFATIFGTTIEKNYSLIKDIYFQLEPFKDRRAGKLSGGMKQKLALCCALIHKPTVLFLDEPTTGVDPVSRKEFWEMLKRLKAQGITILVSTAYMDEAGLCDRIALIQNGKILSVNTPENISTSFPDQLFAVKANKISKLLRELSNFPLALDSYAFGEYGHVVTKKNESGVEDELKKYLSEKGLQNIEVKAITPTIEDSFIKLLK